MNSDSLLFIMIMDGYRMHKINKILILLPFIFSPLFSYSNELNQLINETFPNQ